MSTQDLVSYVGVFVAAWCLRGAMSGIAEYRRRKVPTTRRDLDALPRADITAAQSRDREALDLLSEPEERVLRRLDIGACMAVDLLRLAELAVLDAMQAALLIELLPNTLGRQVATITPRGREALAQRARSAESIHRAETAR